MAKELKIIDLPPEIIERFLPDSDPKTVSTLKLVCWKFHNVFTRDIFYKVYLIYPEAFYMSDLKLKSPAKGVSEIIEEINNKVCGKWKGFLRLQKAHLDNFRSGRFDCHDVVKVRGKTLVSYFEGLDAEDGRWLICIFEANDGEVEEVMITLINLITKQELHLRQSNFVNVYFEQGLLFLESGHYNFHGYKLTAKGQEYSLKPVISFSAVSKLSDAGLHNTVIVRVNFFICSSQTVVMAIGYWSGDRGVILLVLDALTGKITHVDWTSLVGVYMVLGISVSCPDILHVVYRVQNQFSRISTFRSSIFESVKSFKLRQSQAAEFGRVECLSTHELWRESTMDTVVADMTRITSLVAGRLMWQRGNILSVMDLRIPEVERKAHMILVSPYYKTVGFLWPNIILTAEVPEWRASLNGTGVQVNRRNLLLCNWDIDPEHRKLFLKSLLQWCYPSTKAVPCGQSEDNELYFFRIHYF